MKCMSAGQSVYDVRYKTGARLAEEHPVEADLVSCVPTTASVAAKGYATQVRDQNFFPPFRIVSFM